MAQITLRDYLQETEDAIGLKQTDKALANCQSILAHFPDSLEGQRLLGEVYLAQGRLEDAQHAFDWVLSNDPENVIVYCSRALVSARLSDFDTALDCYQQAYELSKGNSQIRQAFNQLSEQVGQQGFMLSRAGLARLYMRGDLLEQSIQEWEVVLAAMPDRLDARTGLLEAYWREGFYDQTAQLAQQILRDVPGCLKALVLLAHVTAPQDMLESQELMKRAEALDPDLITAHDLFSDHIASGSRDPFLKLLKKSPVVIGEDVARLETAQSPVASVESPAVQENAYAYASTSASPSDALATWGSIEGWSNEKTLINPQPDEADQQADTSFSTWRTNGENNTGADVLQSSASDGFQIAEQNGGTGISDPQWSLEAESTVPWSTFQPDMQPAPFSNDSSQAEPWQLLQNALNSINPEVVWSQPSQNEPGQDDALPVQPAQLQPEPKSREQVEEVNVHDESQIVEPQMPSIQEENNPFFSVEEENDPLSPPAWLSMLTQTERNQLSGVMPAVNPTELRQKSLPPVSIPQPEPVHESVNGLSSIGSDARVQDAREEESFFSPDWLKSLGAATLDEDPADESPMTISSSLPPSEASGASETVETVQPQEKAYEVWGTQAEQSQSADDLWAASSLLQQQETPKRGSWLDSLSASPIVEQHEQQEPTPQSLENTLSVETQPETEQEQQEQGEQPGSESWSSHWSEVEQAQPSWLSQMSQPQTQSPNETWQPAPLEVQPQANETSEQNLVTTLEELEQELRSRGFIPMEPKSLSTIAQTQNTSPSSAEIPSSSSHDTQEYGQEPPFSASYDAQKYEPESYSTTSYAEQEYRQEPSLSSALAELGNFIQHPSASSERSNTIPVQLPETPEQSVAELSWLASLSAVPTPITNSSVPEIEASDISKQEEPSTKTTFTYEQQDGQRTTKAALQPTVSSVYAEAAFSPTFDAMDAGVAKNQQEAVRVNPLLDGELETTMKRPAVRLQPMQRRALPAREIPTPSAELAPLNVRSGNTNYRERLLRGYQSQLIGDYDNAMQEYRIIIRNTPELLSEVVSNLRALLKLAPKYAAGYRVLGDAYMRQGEYLQAMEAYNKALTMAKKAKN